MKKNRKGQVNKGANDDQICNKKKSKFKGLRRSFPAAKEKYDTNHGVEETYYNAHTDINVPIERRKETKERTLIVGNESFEATEQCKNDYLSKVEIVGKRPFESIEQSRNDCFSEVEMFYDAQREVHGAIEWEIIESVKNKLEVVECTEKCRPDYFSKAETVEEKSLNSMEPNREDHLSRVIHTVTKKKDDMAKTRITISHTLISMISL